MYAVKRDGANVERVVRREEERVERESWFPMRKTVSREKVSRMGLRGIQRSFRARLLRKRVVRLSIT